jgi:hypothetical protein
VKLADKFQVNSKLFKIKFSNSEKHKEFFTSFFKKILKKRKKWFRFFGLAGLYK